MIYILNSKKRVIFISGKVSMPLTIKKCAVIYHVNGKKTVTPAVMAVKKISGRLIVFETQELMYYVVPQFVPETMIMDERIPVCA